MTNDPQTNPGSFGVEGLTRTLDTLHQNFDTTLMHMRREMHAGFSRLERMVDNVPTRQQFDDAKAALGQAISDAAARITTDLQALRDQLAAGNAITDQDLADIQADTTKLGALDPAVIPVP